MFVRLSPLRLPHLKCGTPVVPSILPLLVHTAVSQAPAIRDVRDHVPQGAFKPLVPRRCTHVSNPAVSHTIGLACPTCQRAARCSRWNHRTHMETVSIQYDTSVLYCLLVEHWVEQDADGTIICVWGTLIPIVWSCALCPRMSTTGGASWRRQSPSGSGCWPRAARRE